MISAKDGTLERQCDRAEHVGEDVCPSFGVVELRIEQRKIKNRESDGALIFDGFQWMGGHNNQPRVGTTDGI